MMIYMREREGHPESLPAQGETVTCEEFQEHMSELIGSDIRDHEHLKSCARCAALLDELEYIADFAREFFPMHEPSDKVWKGIENQMHEPEGREGVPGKHIPN